MIDKVETATAQPIGLAFGQHAERYASFRPPYPEALAQAIVAEVAPGARRCALDLGSGTGLSLPSLLAHFGRVIAVEPDARMAGQIPLTARLEVRVQRAEEVELAAGAIDLVTAGTAFHWFDGPRVLELARRWLAPGGALALYRYTLPSLPGAAHAVVERHLAQHWDAHRHERLRDEAYALRTLGAAPGFSAPRLSRIANVRPLAPEALVGFFASTSYGAAYLRSLADPGAYLAEFAAELCSAQPAGSLEVDFELELIQARAL